ncbi:hypothetical protein [Lysobacter gummosus]|uniref:hypothetical protein n=1 Tax=Lysobacter gummosus TaxID=262324 RepID=UPI00363DB04D
MNAAKRRARPALRDCRGGLRRVRITEAFAPGSRHVPPAPLHPHPEPAAERTC